MSFCWSKKESNKKNEIKLSLKVIICCILQFSFWVSRTIKKKNDKYFHFSYVYNFVFLLLAHVCLKKVIIQGPCLLPHHQSLYCAFDEKWGIRESYSVVPRNKEKQKNWNLFIRSVDELCRILAKVKREENLFSVSNGMCFWCIHSFIVIPYHTNQIT